MALETDDSDWSPNWSNNVANIEETRGRHDAIDKYYEESESGNDKSKSNNNELNNWIPTNKYKRIKNKLKKQCVNIVFNWNWSNLKVALDRQSWL